MRGMARSIFESGVIKARVEVQPQAGSGWVKLEALRTNLNIYRVTLDRSKLREEARIRIDLQDFHGNRLQQDTSLPKEQLVGCAEKLLGQALQGNFCACPWPTLRGHKPGHRV
jgi:hypothetical protein